MTQKKKTIKKVEEKVSKIIPKALLVLGFSRVSRLLLYWQ